MAVNGGPAEAESYWETDALFRNKAWLIDGSGVWAAWKPSKADNVQLIHCDATGSSTYDLSICSGMEGHVIYPHISLATVNAKKYIVYFAGNAVHRDYIDNTYPHWGTPGSFSNRKAPQGNAQMAVLNASTAQVSTFDLSAAFPTLPANEFFFQWDKSHLVVAGKYAYIGWLDLSATEAALKLAVFDITGNLQNPVVKSFPMGFNSASYSRSMLTDLIAVNGKIMALVTQSNVLNDDIKDWRWQAQHVLTLSADGPCTTQPSLGITNCIGTLTVPATFDLDATLSDPCQTISNQAITWSSGNPAVASVNATTGLVTAKADGWAVITAANAEGGLSATCSLTVTSNPIQYTITASAGANGTITPSGSVVVNQGDDKSFTITPNSGYKVAGVLVDGDPAGTETSYTFQNVDRDHTISVSFEKVTTTLYRYLKFRATAAQADRFRLAEIDYKAGGVYYPTQNMTSATAPSPLVVSSSVSTGNYKLYDGSTTTEAFNLASATYVPYWNVIDLGAGNAIAPEEVRIVSGAYAGKGPKDFTVEGSNDGTNWTPLLTVTGETNWGVYAAYTFALSGAKSESLHNEAQKSASSLLVYPNPSADGSVRVVTPQRAVIHVFNSMGLLVQTVVCDGQAEVSGLASGVYVLKAIGTDFAESRTLIVR